MLKFINEKREEFDAWERPRKAPRRLAKLKSFFNSNKDEKGYIHLRFHDLRGTYQAMNSEEFCQDKHLERLIGNRVRSYTVLAVEVIPSKSMVIWKTKEVGNIAAWLKADFPSKRGHVLEGYISTRL